MKKRGIKRQTIEKIKKAWWDLHLNSEQKIRDVATRYRMSPVPLYIIYGKTSNFSVEPTDELIRQFATEAYEFLRAKYAKDEETKKDDTTIVNTVGMTMNEYQKKAESFCLPESDNKLYALFGLAEEVGELQGKLAKAIRKGCICWDDGDIQPGKDVKEEDLQQVFNVYEDVAYELGDVLWMAAHVAHTFGWSLNDVAQININKLTERKQKNTIITHKDH